MAKYAIIIKKSLILSRNKTSKNKIIGCDMPEDYSVLESMFNNYVQDVTKKKTEKIIISSKSL